LSILQQEGTNLCMNWSALAYWDISKTLLTFNSWKRMLWAIIGWCWVGLKLDAYLLILFPVPWAYCLWKEFLTGPAKLPWLNFRHQSYKWIGNSVSYKFESWI
jgi:hypothetical protein